MHRDIERGTYEQSLYSTQTPQKTDNKLGSHGSSITLHNKVQSASVHDKDTLLAHLETHVSISLWAVSTDGVVTSGNARVQK